MQKKVFEHVNLTCVFQNTNNFGSAGSNGVAYGMISPSKDGSLLFQETLPHRRDIRNNRLYEGRLINIVRRKDGLYYPFIKAINPDKVTDKTEFAFRVYQEITEALNCID